MRNTMLIRSQLREKVKPFVRRMAAIGQVYRLGIIYLLAYDPMEVRDIAQNIGIAENLLSHHLKMLLQAGWVSKTKVGKHVTYRLNEKAFFELTRMLEGTPFHRQILAKKIRP